MGERLPRDLARHGRRWESVRPFDFEYADMERPGVPTHIVVHGRRYVLRTFEAVYPDLHVWSHERPPLSISAVKVAFQFEAIPVPPPVEPAPKRRTQLDLGLRRPTTAGE